MNDQPILSLQGIFSNILSFVPALVAGLLVLLVGLLVAWLVARIVVRTLIVLRLDRVLQRLSWGGALAKGDVRHTLFALAGGVIGTLVFLLFLDNVFVIWHLSVLSKLLERLVFVVPDLLVGGLILAVGFAVAAGVSRSVRRTLYDEGIARAALISRIIRAAILVFASALALLHIKVGQGLVTQAFLITFGALAATGVLAVGLGSRKAVEQMWDEVMARRRERQEQDAADGSA
ncbi:MAG: mechanosensitive ion channel family protein [Acidobacteriota bacterium]